MRTGVYGWLVLGLAVAALPWDSLREPHHAEARAGAAEGAQRTVRSLPAAVGATTAPTPDAEIVPAAAARALPGPSIAPARSARIPAAPRDTAGPAATGPATAVREFAPGSRPHAQAIASHIASRAVQDVASPLARLYLASFGRVPDHEGFAYYIGERDRGEPLDAIAEEFAGSEEFAARYGALDDAAFVDLLLQNVRGAGDAAEQRAYWIGEIEAGRMTRGQVMLALSESPAYRALTANEVFVAIAYAETLGRAPDAADLARWVGFLEAGNPRRAVIESLLASRPRPPAVPTPRRD